MASPLIGWLPRLQMVGLISGSISTTGTHQHHPVIHARRVQSRYRLDMALGMKYIEDSREQAGCDPRP